MKIGILSYQGGVAEHLKAAKRAAHAAGALCDIIEVKRHGDFAGLDGLIIPGGESTVMSKLISRNNLWDEIKSVKAIFGTCAGAILLAKKVKGQEEGGQHSLELMDIEADRNAYGSQKHSFEAELDTRFGRLKAVFIRAPKIRPLSERCEVLATLHTGEPVVIAERTQDGRFYLAASFHPELSTTEFHEYFIRSMRALGKNEGQKLA
jgi:5'-phosphate synthase pdxT subunit